MIITASKFNSRVKNIVSGLLLLCILVNGILWINGISYSYIYQRLYRSSVVESIRHTNLPVLMDPVVRRTVKTTGVQTKPVLPTTTKPYINKSASRSTAVPTPSAKVKPAPDVKWPWPPFTVPDGVKIMKVKWNVSNSAPLCQVKGVGPVFVPWSVADLTKQVMTRYIKPFPGGLWAPSNCKAVGKVAVMIPYRARAENLRIFSHHMHYYLQQQQLDYGLFVIEQFDKKRFNRAKLFNIGYIITQLMHQYDCLVLHDIDKIPEDTSYSYACPKHPKHLPAYFRKASDGRNKHKYFSSHYYQGFFGGVSSLRKEHWIAINGMINDYWGWGGEDDELYMRLRIKGIRVIFPHDKNGKFVILYHKPDAVYSHRPMPKRRTVKNAMKHNGLNSVKFELVNITYEPLFTHIKVRL